MSFDNERSFEFDKDWSFALPEENHELCILIKKELYFTRGNNLRYEF